MKTNISIIPFLNKIKDTARNRPVETLLILTLATIACLFRSAEYLYSSTLMTTHVMLPLAFILNAVFPKGHKGRKVYELLSLLSIISIIVGTDERLVNMIDATAHYTISSILALSALLVNNSKNDRKMIENMVTMAWAMLQAGFISVCIFGFLHAITIALNMILGIDITTYVIDIPCYLVLPLITLTLYDHQPRITSIDNKIVNGILNYVVTVAVIIFTIIFYIYIAKILITWELPKGGVVEMCLWFLLLTIVSTCLYRMAKVSSFDWFYHWLTFICLPIAILFWTAIITRIYEYGLTENRVYIVAIGILHIVLNFMAIIDKSRCFSATFYHAIGFFFILGVIPPLSAKNIAFFFSGYDGQPEMAIEENTEMATEEEVQIGRIINEKPYNIDISKYKEVAFPEYDVNDQRRTLLLIIKGDTVAEIEMDNVLKGIASTNSISEESVIQKSYDYSTLPLCFTLNDSTYIVLNDMVILDGKVIGAEPNIMLMR